MASEHPKVCGKTMKLIKGIVTLKKWVWGGGGGGSPSSKRNNK